MLDEGVRAAFGHLGIELRTVAYGEWEAPAASQLVALMEAGCVESAPVWCGDFRRIDAAAFHGTVDIVVAGFPCQDLSVAGRRAGLDGKRSGLFFSVLDFADACGALGLVLENVSGIASASASVVDEEEGGLEERAVSRVLGELADRGWNTEWITLPASDVGASHGRERWFCLAWRMADANAPERGGEQQPREPGQRRGEPAGEREEMADVGVSGRRPTPCADQPRECSLEEQGGARRCECGRDAVGRPEFVCRCMEPLANAAIERRPEGRPESGGIEGGPDAAECRSAVADASSARLPQRVSGGALRDGAPESSPRPVPQLRGDALFAPGPADARWPGILARWPELAPATEPGVRLLVDGVALLVDESRNHQLRQVGNGVVPLQAAVAVVVLARRAGIFGGDA